MVVKSRGGGRNIIRGDGNMFDGGAEDSSGWECLAEADMRLSKRKRSCRNKRRFSDEQIRSLEVMFESDTKLEPRKKAELAKELGLHPRQIAIWFQNRRARWKSKQIEKDYALLLANYNTLASHFDSLNKENQSLSLQLEKLKKETQGQSSSDGESDYGKNIDFQVPDEDSSIKAELLALDEENELLKMAADSSLTSSDDLINQPTQSYQWWDFWG